MPSSTTKFLEPRILDRMSRKCAAAVTVRRIVAVDATDHTKINHCGSNAQAVGVSEVTGAIGDEIQVAIAGILPIEAGGTIALNDEVVSDANGKAVVRGATATVLYKVVGRAITQAASGELVMVAWGPYGVWGANAS